MKKVVSFSGGRTSAYLCHLMIEKFGRDNVDFIFMDTGAEHVETYKFIRRVNQYFNLNLTCLRGDFNQPIGKGHTYKVIDIDDLKPDLGPFKDMCFKYGTPTVASGWCTSRMKQEIHDKFCNDVYGRGNYETWLGIRSDEPSRYLGSNLYKIIKRKFNTDDVDFTEMYLSIVNDGPSVLRYWFNIIPSDIHDNLFKYARKLFEKIKKDNIRYMCEISDDDKDDVLEFWSEMPFDLNIPEWLGNCVFCFKKSDLKLAAAQRDEPEMYIEWLEMIEESPDRNKKEGRSSMHMYRGQRTLPEVIGMFDGSTGNEIKSRIRGARMTDAGSCSESCEVFNCSI